MTSGSLESYFEQFRENTIGRGQTFCFPSGEKEIVYADWTASARGYRPIENCLQNEVAPFFANTHTQTTLMTKAYDAAKAAVKAHVHANEDDALIFCGSEMTSCVNKLQRLLGVRLSGQGRGYMLYSMREGSEKEQRCVENRFKSGHQSTSARC